MIEKQHDDTVFQDAYEEAQRIIRISEEVRISLDEVRNQTQAQEANIVDQDTDDAQQKLTSSKLAAKHKLKTQDLLDRFVDQGLLILNERGKHQLTEQGKSAGGEFKMNQYGGYFLWQTDMPIE